MNLEKELIVRSGSSCELCSSSDKLSVYAVPPSKEEKLDTSILVCGTCQAQLENLEEVDPNHWRCLNDSMWSTEPAVQVVAWRMLHQLKAEGWPQNLLDIMYLENKTLAWAKETMQEVHEAAVIHKDSNGVALISGDSVVVIKDLNVKGTSFTAKRGTAVRNISLAPDNPEQIEGKVNGQQIVLLTHYVKKT